MDRIFLRGLRCQALIGVWEWERRNRQLVLVDVELGADARVAGSSDSIHDTVDYSKVAAAVRETVEGAQFRLVESLGEAIARLIIVQFAAPSVRVRVTKPGILPDVGEVGIELSRERGDYDGA